MNYYRVKTGYGKGEFLSIEQSELPMAINAQINNRVAVFKTGTVAGNHIMSITPDWNKMLGYNPDYVLTGEDIREVPKLKQAEANLAIENAGEIVKAKMENRPPQLKQPEAVRIHTRGPQSLSDLLPR
jgi:hypothetical protein